MKYPVFFLFALLCTANCHGQADSTKLFESSKGTWNFPLRKYNKVVFNEGSTNKFDSTLTIFTDSAYQVHAVYGGRVIGVLEHKGEYSVITRFGRYCIGYHRLEKPDLKRGDIVKAGQKIGKLTNLTQNGYSLELNLYYFEKRTLPNESIEKQINPNQWIDWKKAPK